MQEDPLKEIAVQQLLSSPAHPSLGTPEFVLRDALNIYIVMPFRGVESYQVLTEPAYTPERRFSEHVARDCFRQLVSGAPARRRTGCSLPPAAARRLTGAPMLAAALGHMHSRGVAHLDVSLENVLIDMETMVRSGPCRVRRRRDRACAAS